MRFVSYTLVLKRTPHIKRDFKFGRHIVGVFGRHMLKTLREWDLNNIISMCVIGSATVCQQGLSPLNITALPGGKQHNTKQTPVTH